MTDGSAAKRCAELLLGIGAVTAAGPEPFTLTSGRKSPVYIDCRRLISFPRERREIVSLACGLLRASCDVQQVDFVAGGETAGIAYAAWISEGLDKPMLYVRKKPKGFGRGAQIEGAMPEGARVLLVEDLATDGGSKVAFANALREGGAEVSDVFSVFFYGIFPQSAKILGDAGLSLHYLCAWKHVLAVAREKAVFPEKTLQDIAAFIEDPAAWEARVAQMRA